MLKGYLINSYEIKNNYKLFNVSSGIINAAQRGTTGADDYMSTTTFTLTELKNIKYVNYDFEEGDHAMPGTYSRQYYIDRNKSNNLN